MSSWSSTCGGTAVAIDKSRGRASRLSWVMIACSCSSGCFADTAGPGDGPNLDLFGTKRARDWKRCVLWRWTLAKP